jgi:hypothetical protein
MGQSRGGISSVMARVLANVGGERIDHTAKIDVDCGYGI